MPKNRTVTSGASQVLIVVGALAGWGCAIFLIFPFLWLWPSVQQGEAPVSHLVGIAALIALLAGLPIASVLLHARGKYLLSLSCISLVLLAVVSALVGISNRG